MNNKNLNNIKKVIRDDGKTLEFRPTQSCYKRTPLLGQFMDGLELNLEKLEEMEHPMFRDNN